MVEVVFKVVKESKLYNDYFLCKEEKQKFHDLAREFFKRNGFLEKGSYIQSERLHIELTDEEQEKYSSQLMKYYDNYGMCVFKKKSKIQKKWEEEVYNKVDHSKIEKIKFWWLVYISVGSYALWDYEGDIYGCLKDKSKDSIKLSDDMEEIKMSEYYRVMEESEKGE